MYTKKEKIYTAYVSINNSKHKISYSFKKSKRRSMALYYNKKLPTLLRGITSKHDGDFYCLNCFLSFRTNYKLESHKKVYESKDFCSVVMPSKDPKILEFNQYRKSDKIPSRSIIHADLESLIKKVDGCKNNPEKLSKTKVAEHISCGCSMSAIQTFDFIKK